MEFENAEFEGLKKKKKNKLNDDKIKELEDKLLYQEVYNRRENLRFFGIPESATESSPNWQEEDVRGQASDRSFLAISRT